ncbi:aldo/keto reductase [Phytohabitans sp. ZYX-F-186]|uniref:Aldo/keto reductase n=1 Tax=Phytohabitans maris TaxID=3071409 RepID=A0ABU0ZUW0_9ACTN|nr:aldo/keto reductase [Phytohabitans sp. ZYX-F-186]MDQ7910828.1 aldo/keto reductase [Phytohabitans sp. ZYX-F-186]
MSALCVGTHQLGGDWGPDTDAAKDAVRAAFDRGITFFDGAASYGNGRADAAFAEAMRDILRGRRDEIVLCAKVGLRHDDSAASRRVRDASAGFLRESLDGTLRTLGTDHVDVVMLHFPDPSTGLDETAAALTGLVDSGRARAIGVSNVTPAELTAFAGRAKLSVAQFPFSVLAREPGGSIAATCDRLGIAGMAWAPLAQGFLTDHPPAPADLPEGDYRRYTPWFNDGHWGARFAFAGRFRDLASGYGLRASQVALAWIRQVAPCVVPVFGVQSQKQLLENLGCLDVVLDDAGLAAIGALADDVPPMDLLDAIPRPDRTSRWRRDEEET